MAALTIIAFSSLRSIAFRRPKKQHELNMDTRIKLKIVYVINKQRKKEMFNLTTH